MIIRQSRESGSRVAGVLLAAAVLTVGCTKPDDRDDAAASAQAAKVQGIESSAHGGAGPATEVDRDALLAKVRPILTPLPELAESEANPFTEARAELGRLLYYDARLSKNHDVSCNTCHELDNYGVDTRSEEGRRLARSKGHRGQLGERNSPTVYNAALHVAQFWDGRANDIEEQAKAPILNPVEMAMPDEQSVLRTLRSIPGYAEKFVAAFSEDREPITYDNIGKAIGAFERKLLTPSRYDDFLAGNLDALTEEEVRGLQTFVDVGCATCHAGSALGGTQFQKLGSVRPWPHLEDEGRAAVTQAPADKFMFKVPSLRNITETGPYMHNGSIDSLETMVAMMAEHQTAGGKLPADKVNAILAFLGSLRGEIPKDHIRRPMLPDSGPDTPAPDPR